MKFKNLLSFRRGAFEDQDKEERIPIEFLTKAHNIEIDITGKLKSRRGYEYWMDLLEDESVSSSYPDGPGEEKNIPIVHDGIMDRSQIGFQGKIQKIFQYTDVAGASYIGIVTNGRIFVETVEENGRQWSCLTPNFRFQTISKHIDVYSYLDLLFFNDVGSNIYFYDSRAYTQGSGWLTRGNTFIYFAGDKIYYRDYGDLSASFSTTIQDVATNIDGKAIYDGLDTIEYPYLATLKLGYCLRVGNESLGIKYFVLDNGLNQRADNKCQIIRFDENLVAEDYVEFDMQDIGEILNFDYYREELEATGYVYLFCKDGYIYKINETNLEATRMMNDALNMAAPTNSSGKKQYSVAVNIDGVFVYTVGLPDKDDWWQPVITSGGLIISNAPPLVAGGFGYGNSIFIFAKDIKSGIAADFVGQWYRDIPYNNTYMQGLKAYLHTFSTDVNKMNIINFRKDLTDSLLAPTVMTSGSTVRVYSMNYYIVSFLGLLTVRPGVQWWTYKSATTWANQKFIHHPYFQYDKENAVPADQDFFEAYESNTKLRRKTNTMYLIEEDFNTNIFTSKTQSNYVLLAALDQYGNLKYRDEATLDEGTQKWRYIIPCGKAIHVKNIVPLVVSKNDDEETIIYFGTDMDDSVAGDNHGKYIKWNIETFDIEMSATSMSARRLIIEGDDRWFVYDDTDDKYKINETWDPAGTLGLNDYTDLDTYSSNLSFHIRRQVIDYSGNVQVDKLQELGTPDIPSVSTGYDNTSTLVAGTQVRYYAAFQFFDGNTTPLSPASYPLTISANNKVIISGLNLLDINDVNIYDVTDVEYIQLYRSRKDINTDFWTDPNLIATLERDNGGDWYYSPPTNPFAAQTFEDNTQSYAYSPWTGSNATKYPVKDMFVHRNRLILVNKLNEDNSNVVQYSDTDRARSIPSDNTRPIESGDGDQFVGGLSSENYAYFFKERKIYAILGDVPTGQIIDISRTIGTKYKNMTVSHGGVVYFLSDTGIYKIVGAATPVNLMQERMKNYFNKERDDSIDFENLDDHGIIKIDTENNEIRFIVPQKREGVSDEDVKNNLHIIYNIERDHFKTKEYYHNIFDEAETKNILTNEYQYLMADYEGNVFQISKSKNDDGEKIKYVVRTKNINLQTSVIPKIFKMIKIAGRYLTKIKIMYWIDGERMTGEVFYRDQNAFTKVWHKGRTTAIMIEISGEQLNEPPVEVSEILLGFDRARGIK